MLSRTAKLRRSSVYESHVVRCQSVICGFLARRRFKAIETDFMKICLEIDGKAATGAELNPSLKCATDVAPNLNPVEDDIYNPGCKVNGSKKDSDEDRISTVESTSVTELESGENFRGIEISNVNEDTDRSRDAERDTDAGVRTDTAVDKDATCPAEQSLFTTTCEAKSLTLTQKTNKHDSNSNDNIDLDGQRDDVDNTYVNSTSVKEQISSQIQSGKSDDFLDQTDDAKFEDLLKSLSYEEMEELKIKTAFELLWVHDSIQTRKDYLRS